jgi:hypothetical protein
MWGEGDYQVSWHQLCAFFVVCQTDTCRCAAGHFDNARDAHEWGRAHVLRVHREDPWRDRDPYPRREERSLT